MTTHRTPDSPTFVETGRTRQLQLFFSNESDSILLPVLTLTPGFGEMLTGTVVAENRSRAGNQGQMAPYVPTALDKTTSPWGKGSTPLVADVADGALTARIPLPMANRFVLGDDLVVHSTAAQNAENLGAITAIDVSSGAYADITFTIPVTNASGFTVANTACVYVASSFVATLTADVALDGTSLVLANDTTEGLAVGAELVVAATDVDAVSVGLVKSLTVGATTTAVEITTAPGSILATANKAMCYVRRPGLVKAVGVLTRNRETGEGNIGAPTHIHSPICFGKATLYRAVMGNLDAAAMDDLSMKTRAEFAWF